MAGGAQKKVASVANATASITKNSNVMGREVRKNLEGLQAQLVKLESLQAKAWDPKHIQNYQRAINKTKDDIAKWHQAKQLPELQPPKPNWFGRMRSQFNEAISQTPLAGSWNLLKSPALLAGAGAVMLASFGKAATDASMQFEHGMSKINATAQLPAETLGKLKGRLLDIGSHSGGNFDNITNAYEKILSTTGKVNLSLDITQTAVKGAQAGFADIDLVAGALAQTLASVGHKNATANEVMDTLLKAKAVGAGEFADFAQYLPQLIAAGRNLGITFKDTAGIFSFMTFKGQSATDSAMLMQNAFTALQKKDIIVGLKAKGVDLFNADGSRKNIQKVFVELEGKMRRLTDKQKTKFMIDIGLMDAQARNAFSVLTSDAKEFQRVMNEVNNSIGETDRQLAATGDRTRTWGNIGDEWKSVAVKTGDILMPIVDAVTSVVSGIVTTTSELLSKEYWKKMFGFHAPEGVNRDKAERDRIDWMDRQYAEQYTGASTQTGVKKFGLPMGMSPEELNYLKEQKAYEIAGKLYREKFGYNITNNIDKAPGGKNHAWYKATLDRAMKAAGLAVNKNEIDPNEKPEPKNKPTNLIAGIDNTSFDKDKEGGGNKGLKTLIMNLDIKNYNHTKEDMDKFPRKFTDDLVDAARDGMATIGIE